MKKLILSLCLFLVGCNSIEKDNEMEVLKHEIEQLKEEIPQSKTGDAEVEEVISMNREEASIIIKDYLNSYQFDDIVGEIIVNDSKGNDGKMEIGRASCRERV